MDFGVARENMIECQLRTNKITDSRILGAMSTLPRERFVPREREEMCPATAGDRPPFGRQRGPCEPGRGEEGRLAERKAKDGLQGRTGKKRG